MRLGRMTHLQHCKLFCDVCRGRYGSGFVCQARLAKGSRRCVVGVATGALPRTRRHGTMIKRTLVAFFAIGEEATSFNALAWGRKNKTIKKKIEIVSVVALNSNDNEPNWYHFLDSKSPFQSEPQAVECVLKSLYRELEVMRVEKVRQDRNVERIGRGVKKFQNFDIHSSSQCCCCC